MNKIKETKTTSETFRLNRGVEVDAEIIDFLAKSNNKSGLIKDALMMYKALVETGAYNSPFLVNTATDWTRVLANLDPSKLLGQTQETVKENIKKELRSQQVVAPAPVVEETDEEVYEEIDEDEDNELDF